MTMVMVALWPGFSNLLVVLVGVVKAVSRLSHHPYVPLPLDLLKSVGGGVGDPL